jgi:hypothetical protein
VSPGLSEQLPEGSLDRQYIKTVAVKNVLSKTVHKCSVTCLHVGYAIFFVVAVVV